MIHRFRVILDVREDVFRDIEIDSENTFEDLHNAIISSFSLDGMQMASFYQSDDEWNQGEEIALFDMSEGNQKIKIMSNYKLSDLFTGTHQRMLYAYDFMNIKTFYVEVMNIDQEQTGLSYPRVSYSFGDTPDYTDDDFEEIDDPDALDFDDEEGLDPDDIFAGDDELSGSYDSYNEEDFY